LRVAIAKLTGELPALETGAADAAVAYGCEAALNTEQRHKDVDSPRCSRPMTTRLRLSARTRIRLQRSSVLYRSPWIASAALWQSPP
jgi:hypothetical protein